MQVMLYPKCFAQTILIFNMLRSGNNPAGITCVARPNKADVDIYLNTHGKQGDGPRSAQATNAATTLMPVARSEMGFQRMFLTVPPSDRRLLAYALRHWSCFSVP
jgi:hypothetical protein